MNKFVLLIVFIICITLTCCKSSSLHVSLSTRVTLEKMIGSWNNTLCDYPKTLDEFISVNEAYDNWKELPIKDSVEATLSFLKKEKEHIIWRFSHPSVTSMDLTIIHYNDTIYRKAGEWLFPGLDVSLIDYNKYYFEFPSSVEKLIAYDSLAKKDHDGFYQCCDKTLEYIMQNKSDINWKIIDEAKILIMSGEDTITYQLGCYPQVLLCDESVVCGSPIFRFFDINGNYAYSEDVERALKIGLSALRYNYAVLPPEQTIWHIMVYTNEDGLQPYCRNDDLSIETKWFVEVEDFMCNFCKEHVLGKVIFMSPSYKSK